MARLPDSGNRGYFDQRFNAHIINVAPGGHGITKEPDQVLSTVLGSCVAACLRDPLVGIGGMNHFLLPGDDEGDDGPSQDDMRFGTAAMEVLINELLKAGALRSRLEAKIFGGSVMLASSVKTAVGSKNAAFAQRFLARECIRTVAKDLGGNRPRRVNYEPATGRAWVNWLAPQSVRGVSETESAYRKSLACWDQNTSLDVF